jgi:hypothetical protein
MKFLLPWSLLCFQVLQVWQWLGGWAMKPASGNEKGRLEPPFLLTSKRELTGS